LAAALGTLRRAKQNGAIDRITRFLFWGGGVAAIGGFAAFLWVVYFIM
jgi:hypothetical protein